MGLQSHHRPMYYAFNYPIAIKRRVAYVKAMRINFHSRVLKKEAHPFGGELAFVRPRYICHLLRHRLIIIEESL